MIYFLDINEYGNIPENLILLNQLNFLITILIFLIITFFSYYVINSVMERKN